MEEREMKKLKISEQIIFVRGFGGTHRGFEFQMDFFSSLPNYQSVAFDNRGVGFSDVPEPPYTMYQMVGDVFSLANHLKWDRFHLVGTSLGGMISQHVALIHPEKILSLTLICTRIEGGLIKWIPTFWGTVGFIRSAIAKDQDSFLEAVADLQYPKSYLDIPFEGGTNRDKVLAMLKRLDNGLPETTTKARKGQMAVLRAHGLSPAEIESLKKTKFPKLAIVGDADILIPPLHSYKMPLQIGAKLLVIKGAGHSVMQQCPKELNNAIKDLIEVTLKNDIVIENTNGDITNTPSLTDWSSSTFASEKPINFRFYSLLLFSLLAVCFFY